MKRGRFIGSAAAVVAAGAIAPSLPATAVVEPAVLGQPVCGFNVYRGDTWIGRMSAEAFSKRTGLDAEKTIVATAGRGITFRPTLAPREFFCNQTKDYVDTIDACLDLGAQNDPELRAEVLEHRPISVTSVNVEWLPDGTVCKAAGAQHSSWTTAWRPADPT